MFCSIVVVSHSGSGKHKWQALGSASGHWLVTHDNRRLPIERSLVPEVSKEEYLQGVTQPLPYGVFLAIVSAWHPYSILHHFQSF